jgi:hypothetical protein
LPWQAVRTLTAGLVTIHSVFDSDGRRLAEYNEATGALIREDVWNRWGEAEETNSPEDCFPAERPERKRRAGGGHQGRCRHPRPWPPTSAARSSPPPWQARRSGRGRFNRADRALR